MELLSKELKPFNWDIIYLGKCHDNCGRYTFITNQLVENISPVCRHAYAVTRKGARVILDNTLPIRDSGDGMVKLLITGGYLNGYAITPSLFHQNRKTLGSYLGNTGLLYECSSKINLGTFDDNPFYKVSVIILNQGSTENTDEIRQNYIKYGVVDDIIVYDINSNIVSPKNKAVLIQDNDTLLPENSIVILANILQQKPRIFHRIEDSENLDRAIMMSKKLSKKFINCIGNKDKSLLPNENNSDIYDLEYLEL